MCYKLTKQEEKQGNGPVTDWLKILVMINF